MKTDIDYWKECIGQAADDCELKLTAEQLECFAEAASSGHEHYGMAFYSPPSGEYADSIERKWQEKYTELEKRLKDFEDRAEKAIRRVCRISDDRIVSIDKHGYVEVMAR